MNIYSRHEIKRRYFILRKTVQISGISKEGKMLTYFNWFFTLLGDLRGLLRPDAITHGLVENKTSVAGILSRGSFNAVVIPNYLIKASVNI